MPWNVRDYPASMKNLDPLVRKKAIDIANALLADGYSDDRAIPIATSQAEKWYDNADEEEKKAFQKEKNPQKSGRRSYVCRFNGAKRYLLFRFFVSFYS